MREELSWWKWFFFRQKVRFDLGYQFMAFVNFTLLVIAASDKLLYYTNLPRTWMLVAIAVPTAFCGVWVFGYFLDRVVRYNQAYNVESAKRNPIIDEQMGSLRRIEEELKRIIGKTK